MASKITSHAGIRIPVSREDGDPHRAHLAQDPLIIQGNEDSAGIHEHGGPLVGYSCGVCKVRESVCVSPGGRNSHGRRPARGKG